MPKTLQLLLKPQKICFYSPQDCPKDKKFFCDISHKQTIYKSTLLSASIANTLDLHDFMWI